MTALNSRVRRRLCSRCVLVAASVLAEGSALAAQASDSAWLASKGFYLRRAEALLHHDRAGLLRRRGQPFSRVVAEAPGVRARRTTDGLVRIRFAPEPGAVECEPEIHVNGSRMEQRLAAADLSLDQLIRVYDLDGIEVFDADHAPLGDGTGCAVILAWSFRAADRRDPEFTGVLRGQALRGDGAGAVGDIEVVLEPGGWRQRTGSDGRFDFGALPPANYRVTATAPGGEAWTAEVRVRAYSASEILITITLDTTGSFAGVQPLPEQPPHGWRGPAGRPKLASTPPHFTRSTETY